MLKKLIRDPLTLFIAAGILIYGLQAAFASSNDNFQIDIRPADLQRLQDQWTMQMRRPASEPELQGLIEQFIKEEIYYREALRMGLDQNDTIVRRRLVQKLTFLTEDIATASPPSDAELQDYYQNNKQNYAIPERISFKHRYFSSDRRPAAREDADKAVNDVSEQGDPFMLQREYAARSEREIGDLFGRAFAQALFALPPGEEWQGPVQSAYGWHAVLISTLQASRVPSFDEVYERVLIDAKQAARQLANQAYFEQLKANYTVSMPVNQTAVDPS